VTLLIWPFAIWPFAVVIVCLLPHTEGIVISTGGGALAAVVEKSAVALPLPVLPGVNSRDI
jgi:hypothetical protein